VGCGVRDGRSDGGRGVRVQRTLVGVVDLHIRGAGADVSFAITWLPTHSIPGPQSTSDARDDHAT